MIDWDDVMERAGIVIAGILTGIAVLCFVLFVSICLIFMIFGGLALTLEGLWFFGVPIFAFGVALAVATIVLVFAKIMSIIQEWR